MQTKDEMIQSITAMLSSIDDIGELERIYRYMHIHTGSGSTEKESYKNQIVEMIEQIDNQTVLVKIYTVVRTHLMILNEKEQEG